MLSMNYRLFPVLSKHCVALDIHSVRLLPDVLLIWKYLSGTMHVSEGIRKVGLLGRKGKYCVLCF